MTVVKETKENLRKMVKNEYVTIKNFCKKKNIDYLQFRVFLNTRNRTRSKKILEAITEFGNETTENLKNKNLKKKE